MTSPAMPPEESPEPVERCEVEAALPTDLEALALARTADEVTLTPPVEEEEEEAIRVKEGRPEPAGALAREESGAVVAGAAVEGVAVVAGTSGAVVVGVTTAAAAGVVVGTTTAACAMGVVATAAAAVGVVGTSVGKGTWAAAFVVAAAAGVTAAATAGVAASGFTVWPPAARKEDSSAPARVMVLVNTMVACVGWVRFSG